MRAEIKELLKDKIQEVNKSKTSFIVGALLLVLDVVLVISSIFNIYSLIFILPLVYIVRRQFILYKIKQSSLMLMRFLVDDEYDIDFD
jgi:hypothetical protein